jgi:hypothetical protein
MKVLAILAVLFALSACGRSTLGEDRRSTETIRKATVYLIALEDSGDCGGDSAVPFEVELGSPSPALGGSIEALLALRDRSDGSGFYNALADSPLKIEKMERTGDQVRVYLTGYLELGGKCDGPRVLSQLTETATQFGDVESVELFLDGKPLKELLSDRG